MLETLSKRATKTPFLNHSESCEFYASEITVAIDCKLVLNFTVRKFLGTSDELRQELTGEELLFRAGWSPLYSQPTRDVDCSALHPKLWHNISRWRNDAAQGTEFRVAPRRSARLETTLSSSSSGSVQGGDLNGRSALRLHECVWAVPSSVGRR